MRSPKVFWLRQDRVDHGNQAFRVVRRGSIGLRAPDSCPLSQLIARESSLHKTFYVFWALFDPKYSEPGMNAGEVIEALRHEHRSCAWPGETLERCDLVTRHTIGSIGQSFVTAYALTEANADRAIAGEIAYFAALGQPFEWKLFSFDRPPDLLQRLTNAGFTIGEREAIMIYDLQDGLAPFKSPTCEVRRIEREEDLRDFRLLAEEAFGKDYSPTTNSLAEAIRKGEDGHVAYVAYLDGQPASAGRLYTSPNSQFAGCYGGGTRPQFRGRGAYRALVSARAHATHRSGARYLLVDAMPTSRPILQSLGFTHVADTSPCDSPA